MDRDASVEWRAGATEVYDQCVPGYQRTLIAPQDDMWAAFADKAEPHAIIVDGIVTGCCAIDEEHALHRFYLHPHFERHGEDLFGRLVTDQGIGHAFASTVDPALLSLCLDTGGRVETVAIVFRHVEAPSTTPLPDLRRATMADHAAAVAFDREATGSPEAFLVPFLRERIAAGELLLHETDGEIVATGECRTDHRAPGHAQLGLIVGVEHRGAGVGSRLMVALVEESRRRGLRPLCSTEPDNVGARKAIERAGFVGRHRVYRIQLDGR